VCVCVCVRTHISMCVCLIVFICLLACATLFPYVCFLFPMFVLSVYKCVACVWQNVCVCVCVCLCLVHSQTQHTAYLRLERTVKKNTLQWKPVPCSQSRFVGFQIKRYDLMNFLFRTQGKRPVYYCDCTLYPVMPFLISDTHTIYKVLMRNGTTQ